jgi:hypothetical protein
MAGGRILLGSNNRTYICFENPEHRIPMIGGGLFAEGRDLEYLVLALFTITH